jgi:thymidylate kinase
LKASTGPERRPRRGCSRRIWRRATSPQSNSPNQPTALSGGEGPEALARQRELFTLDRRDHVKRKIEPLLAFVRAHAGFLLVQSRYYLSAPAYQAAELDDSELNTLLAEQRAFAPPPDLFIVLDLPVDSAIERIAKRGESDLYEKQPRLEMVRRRYEMLRELEPTPQVWIDATAPIEVVREQVRDSVLAR